MPPFVATRLKNNQPHLLTLPAPFRGVLKEGATIISYLPPEKVKWLLDRNGLYARELVIEGVQMSSPSLASFTNGHSPALDEWSGTLLTTDGASAAVVWRGPAEYGGKLKFIPGLAACYGIDITVVAKRTNGADAASYQYRAAIETDSNGLVVNSFGGDAPTPAQETDSSWGFGIVAANGTDFMQLNLTGASGKSIRWNAFANVQITPGF